MKRWGILLAAIAALASTGSALALTMSSARLEANSTAYTFMSHKTWGSEVKVGACHRLSAARVNCDARVTGDQLKDCVSGPEVICTYVFHSCQFTAAVHEAGSLPLGRVQGVRCRTRQHTG